MTDCDRGVIRTDCPYLTQIQVVTWVTLHFKQYKKLKLSIASYEDFVDLSANDTPAWFEHYTDVVEAVVLQLIREVNNKIIS